MSITPETTGDEAGVQQEIEDWADAIRHRDVDGVLRHFVVGSTRFYLAPPLQADTPLKDNVESWFNTFNGPIGYEIRDLEITVGGDVAFAHSFNHISGTKTDGQGADVWFRETLCFRKLEGRWLIAHAHESVPFLMDGSLRAAVNLQPPTRAGGRECLVPFSKFSAP